MKNPCSKRWFAIAFLTIAWGSAASFAGAQQLPPMAEALKRMDDHNKSLQSLQADLKMDKYEAALKVNDPPMLGKTKYLPSSKLTKNKRYARIDWKNPEEQMSVIGDQFMVYRPRLNQVIKGTTQKTKGGSKAASIMAFMTMSRKELRANYTPEYLGEETIDLRLTWHIRLTPNGAASYKTSEIWIDQDGMPRQIKVTEKNEDTTTLLLTHIEKNIKIDTKVFALDYPRNVQVSNM